MRKEIRDDRKKHHGGRNMGFVFTHSYFLPGGFGQVTS